jgi:hypothetical protein
MMVEVRRMFLAWKKFHRFDASIWELSAAVWALCPSSRRTQGTAPAPRSAARPFFEVPVVAMAAAMLIMLDLVFDLVLNRVL